MPQKYWRKIGQCISYLESSRKLMSQLRGRSYRILSVSLVIAMELVGLIKTCLKEPTVQFGKTNMSDTSPTKNGLTKVNVYLHLCSALL